MEAEMKDNLILRYQKSPELDYRSRCRISCPLNEMQAVKEMHGMEDYFDLKTFLKSIEGKAVNLVFTGGDAFGEKDNNFWLPNDLWTAV